MNYLRMDLKVCEGCGALWLRAGIEEGVYCRSCAALLAEFPKPGSRGARMSRRRVTRTRVAHCAGGAQ